MSEEKKSGLEKQIDRAEARARAKLEEALGAYLLVWRSQRAMRGEAHDEPAFEGAIKITIRATVTKS